MNLEKKIKIIIISIIASVIITVLGNMIFWSIAMGKVEVYPSSPKEYLFIENVEEKNKLAINYNDMSKSSNVRDINIYERGYEHPIIAKTKCPKFQNEMSKKKSGMVSHFWLEKNIKTKGSLMID